MLKQFTRFNPSALDFDAMRESAQFSRNPQKLRELQSETAPPELTPDLNQSEQELARLEKRQVSLNPEPAESSRPEATESDTAQSPVRPAGTNKAPDPAAEKAAQAKVAQQIRMQKSKVRTQILQDLNHQLKTFLAQAQSKQNTDHLHAKIWSCQSSITAPYGGKTAPSENEGLGVVRPFLVKQSQKLNILKNKQPELFPRIQQAEVKVLNKIKQFKGLPLPEKSALCALAKLLNQLLSEMLQVQEPTATTSESPTIENDAPEETLNLPEDPDQIRRELFQLKAQLRQDGEKASIQAQIQAREAALESLQWQKTQQLLQRALRSFSLLCDKVERLQNKLNKIENHEQCLELLREQKYCRNLVQRELQRLNQHYAQQQKDEAAGPQFFLAQLQSFGSLEQDEPQAPQALSPALREQLPTQLCPAFEQLAHYCQTLYENLQTLAPELHYQGEWYAAQSRLDALEQLEHDYADIDTEIAVIEKQLHAEESESEALLKSLYALHLEKWELYAELPGQLPQIGEHHARN